MKVEKYIFFSPEDTCDVVFTTKQAMELIMEIRECINGTNAKEDIIEWKSSLPKESGEYLVTIQTKPYTNEGNETIFAKFDAKNTKAESYGFTHLDGSPITDIIISWAEKPLPCKEYFAP